MGDRCVGAPQRLDDLVAPGVGADDHEAVNRLTDDLTTAMRAVSLDVDDQETAVAMEQAATIALSDVAAPEPSLRSRYDLTRALGGVPPEAREGVAVALGRYTTLLSGLHLTDRDIVAPTNPRRLLRSAVGLAVLVVVLGGVGGRRERPSAPARRGRRW